MEKSIYAEYFIKDLNRFAVELEIVYIHHQILNLLSDTSELQIGGVIFKHSKSLSLGIEDGQLRFIKGLELIKSGLVGINNGSKVILSFNSEDDKNRFKDKFINIINLLIHIIKLQTKVPLGKLSSDFLKQETIFVYKGDNLYKSRFYF